MPLTEEQEIEQSRRAQNDYNIFMSVKRVLVRYGGDLMGKSILDIGCGKTFPQPLLYNTFGSRNVVGIDITTFVDLKNPPEEQACYYHKLEEVAGRPLLSEGLQTLNIDVKKMPFADNYFDFVISNAAFEHIDDVPATIIEMKRVMKKNSIGHIGIHLFPSLSGSHHPSLQKNPLTEIPQGVAPWYHLRGINDYTDTSLNKLREDQYREIFQDNFELLEWQVPTFEEGRQFLTEEIKYELDTYSEEELLRRWCIAIIRN